jgi:hypothetical protein
MSDTKEGEDIVPKGNEWEVVALTESTYAAAPGPKQDVLDQFHSNVIEDGNTETSGAMFMSGHFGLSPSMHENLLQEPSSKEKPLGMDGDHGDMVQMDSDHGVSEDVVRQGGKSEKHEDDMHIEGLISEELHEAPNFDEKGNKGSFYSSDFGDVASSNLTVKEHSMYSTVKFDSYDDKATAGRSYKVDEDNVVAEPFESLDHAINPGLSNVQKHDEEDRFNQLPSGPCDAWWRRHAVSLYGHAKNATPYWSIVVAAAVVGLVIIGHRWQRDKPQVFKLKPQLFIDDEGSGWILGPVARLKGASLGGQNSSYISVISSTEL